MQAVRESGAKHKRISKIKKKFLTNRTGCVKLKKLRDEKRIAWSAANSTKEFKKLCKKCLTNSTRCDNISKFAAGAKTTETNLENLYLVN